MRCKVCVRLFRLYRSLKSRFRAAELPDATPKRAKEDVDPMFEVKVPEVGESISEGEIVTWFKQDGDMVQVDDELFELETDKITATVAAEVAGKLSIKKGVDEVVAIHEIVATIDTSATGGDAPAASKASEAETAAPASAPASSGASGDVMSPAARHHAARPAAPPPFVGLVLLQLFVCSVVVARLKPDRSVFEKSNAPVDW